MNVTMYWNVMEHYDDEAPEPFGHVALDHEPEVGEVVQLKWLDGSDAYRVRVDRVGSDMTLHVKAI